MKPWHKIIISVGIAGVLVVVLGVWAISGAHRFFYPKAPPMPAVVSESMSDILAQLDGILKTNAPAVLAGLQPGLAAGDIAQLEQKYHIQLPDDLRALYMWHNGVRPITNTAELYGQITNTAAYDFIPIHRFVPLEEALADRAAFAPQNASLLQWLVYRFFTGHREPWLCVFSDELGDDYYFDPTRKPSEGAVFYTSTEEGEFIFFPSFKNVMAGVAECYDKGIYRVKFGTMPPQLDEDFEKSAKVWTEFGAGNQP